MLRYIVCLLMAVGLRQTAAQAKSSVKVERMNITSVITYRFNKVTIESEMVNEGYFSEDMIFKMSVPNEAFISDFTIKFQGSLISSRVVNQLNNLLRGSDTYTADNYNLRPRETSFFQVRINAPAGARCVFSLTYEEMLIRRGGKYEPVLYLHPGNVVDDLHIIVKIHETRPLIDLKVPAIRGELIKSEETGDNNMATISMLDSMTAIIECKPTREQQLAESGMGLKGLFTVNYDIERGNDAGDLLMFGEYFLHFFAPKEMKILPRDIVFVLDDSGSMSDGKLIQLKTSMYKILDLLTTKDRMHFIQFSNLVVPREQGFLEVTPESVDGAKKYIESEFVAKGGTNINDAILKGIRSFGDLPADAEPRTKMLIFLTDGQATAGEIDRDQILKNLREANAYGVSVFSIGFGFDADYALMKRMSFENKGVATRIYDGVDAEMQLYIFFLQISKILRKGLSFKYDSSFVDKDALLMFGDGNYYQGSEMGAIGKLRKGFSGDLDVKVKEMINGRAKTLRGIGNVRYIRGIPKFMTKVEFSKRIERMWAFVLIKQIMRNLYMRKYSTNFRQMYLLLSRLSLKYGFLNSLTKMTLSGPPHITTKFSDITPDYQKDSYGLAASTSHQYLEARSRGIGVVYDPHFIVDLPTLEFPLCFEVRTVSGQNILLLDDPTTAERVTATVIASKVRDTDGHYRTYLGAVKVTHSMVALVATPRLIRVNGIPLSWYQETTLTIRGMRVVVTGSGQYVNVYLNNGTGLMIQRIAVSHTDPKRVSFLNFYITDYSGFSTDTTGLIGQFVHTNIYMNKQKKFEMLSDTQQLHGNDGNGRLFKINATLIERLEMLDSRSTRPCWKIPMSENGALFSGKNLNNFFIKSL
ncbi:inter-alpha-trypsin inhibitor heavy chain H5-like [Argonauta hians]